MTKIIRTTIFLLVLVGLLTWGASTLAQAPTRASMTPLTDQARGQELQTVEHSSLDGVRRVSR